VLSDAIDIQIQIQRNGHPAVVCVRGEIDLATAPLLRSALDEARDGAAGDILVDLTDVGFFDCQAVNVFAETAYRLRETGHRLTLNGVSLHQHRILRICAMTQLMSITDSPQPSAAPCNPCAAGW
jgi:anti-sigma B factor antagonist